MKYALAFILSLLAVPAFAQSSIGTDATADAGAEAGAAATLQNATIFQSESEKQAPGIALGGVGTSISSEFCAGAAQGGVSSPLGSVLLGKSINDPFCNKRRNVAITMQMSNTYDAKHDVIQAGKFRQAATNIMCGLDKDTYEAYMAAGIQCQVKKPKK